MCSRTQRVRRPLVFGVVVEEGGEVHVRDDVAVHDQDGGARSLREERERSPRAQRAILTEVLDVAVERRPVPEVGLDLVAPVVHGEEQPAKAVIHEAADDDLEQRLAAHREHRLGCGFGQRTQTAPLPSGHDHGPVRAGGGHEQVGEVVDADDGPVRGEHGHLLDLLRLHQLAGGGVRGAVGQEHEVAGHDVAGGRFEGDLGQDRPPHVAVGDRAQEPVALDDQGQPDPAAVDDLHRVPHRGRGRDAKLAPVGSHHDRGPVTSPSNRHRRRDYAPSRRRTRPRPGRGPRPAVPRGGPCGPSGSARRSAARTCRSGR